MNAVDFLTGLGRSSLAGGILVLLVLALQRIFRRQLSPGWHCALWLLVAARLLPFSVRSEASVFNLLPAWMAGTEPVADVTRAPPPASQREAGTDRAAMRQHLWHPELDIGGEELHEAGVAGGGPRVEVPDEIGVVGHGVTVTQAG